ncbi:MAG: hypothetical protein WCJ88_01950 [Actinomycetes bacterium]
MEHDTESQTVLNRDGDGRWVLLGTIGAGGRAKVDRHGLISPEDGAWSLDWWVRAEDRWHVASGGALVRQSLTDSTPVVVSAMRVPGGEIEQRAWTAIDGPTGLPVLVAEFENATSVPVALALSFTAPAGASPTSPVTMTYSESVVSINAMVAAMFSRQPSRFGIDLDGRSAQELTVTGDAVLTFPAEGVRASAGPTTAAFVFPLPHTAVLRVVLPLSRDGKGTSSNGHDLDRIDVTSLPPRDRVVSGWKAQLARSPRIDLPERQIEEALDAARAHLLVHVAADDPLRWPSLPVDGLERSELTMALDEQGLSAEAERLLFAAIDLQNADGSFDADRLDATASWIEAVGRHVAITGDVVFAEASVERIASAAHWLAKRQRGSRIRPSRAFFAAGEGPPWISSVDRRSYDARWTARAYRSAISLLDLSHQPDAARAIGRHLEELVAGMDLYGFSAVGPGDGERRIDAIEVLRSELLEGEPLWAWPGAIDAHDPARTAAFLRNVRALVVDDRNGVVDLLPGFGEEWLGQPVAMLRLPTVAGSVSYALRWHGARPALLWEVDGDRPFTLTCLAFDANWSTTERRGEVLLAAPVLDHEHHDHQAHHEFQVNEHDHTHSDHAHLVDIDEPEVSSKPVAKPPDDGGGSFS